MPGDIYRFLTDDHARLDALLKHIGMEEMILLSAAQKRRGGEPLLVAAKLRLDHGARCPACADAHAGDCRRHPHYSRSP